MQITPKFPICKRDLPRFAAHQHPFFPRNKWCTLLLVMSIIYGFPAFAHVFSASDFSGSDEDMLHRKFKNANLSLVKKLRVLDLTQIIAQIRRKSFTLRFPTASKIARRQFFCRRIGSVLFCFLLVCVHFSALRFIAVWSRGGEADVIKSLMVWRHGKWKTVEGNAWWNCYFLQISRRRKGRNVVCLFAN